jgi:thioredoxin reductase
MNNVPLMLGYTPQGAEVRDGKVHLHLRGQDGTQREVVADHVISATGYKVDLERLTFLSSEIRSQLKSVANTPVLSSSYESSVPGLYFVGVAAANSFGPVMRFAFGADFAARTVSRALAKAGARKPVRTSNPGAVTATKKEDGKALASSAGD